MESRCPILLWATLVLGLATGCGDKHGAAIDPAARVPELPSCRNWPGMDLPIITGRFMRISGPEPTAPTGMQGRVGIEVVYDETGKALFACVERGDAPDALRRAAWQAAMSSKATWNEEFYRPRPGERIRGSISYRFVRGPHR